MRFGLAIRAFWKAMFDRAAAERLALALDSVGDDGPAGLGDKPSVAPETAAKKEDAEKTVVMQTPPVAVQNSAIALLSTLQRDARLIDLIHENLDQYADEQIGAAARPCLKQCRQTLDRLLKIQPLVSAAEGDSIPVQSGASSARVRWVGESTDRGTAQVIHTGWQATQIELPSWSGAPSDTMVIAPTQVQGH